jgi:ribonuclease HII
MAAIDQDMTRDTGRGVVATASRTSRKLRSSSPSLRWEQQAWRDGKLIVAGVDEAGRGAWAGPLVAAAVVLPRDPQARGRITRAINRAETAVRDSKMLSADQRERVMEVLTTLGVPHAVAVIEVEELDAIGLARANPLALCRAVEGLTPEPEHVLVDAFRLNDLRCSHLPIIHGDNLSQTIAMASIVAKLHRDALMTRLNDEHPDYGFASHKGYGTAFHRAAIERHGVMCQHRTSFAPIAELLARGAGD